MHTGRNEGNTPSRLFPLQDGFPYTVKCCNGKKYQFYNHSVPKHTVTLIVQFITLLVVKEKTLTIMKR